jgi:hypothetical protein
MTERMCQFSCEKVALFECSKCRNTYYCSKECQTGDWLSHKTTCGKTLNDPTKFYIIMNLVYDGAYQFTAEVEEKYFPPLDHKLNSLLDLTYLMWPPLPPGSPKGEGVIHVILSVPIRYQSQLIEIARLHHIGMEVVRGSPSYPDLIIPGKRVYFPIVDGPNVYVLINKERPPISQERLVLRHQGK